MEGSSLLEATIDSEPDRRLGALAAHLARCGRPSRRHQVGAPAVSQSSADTNWSAAVNG